MIRLLELVDIETHKDELKNIVQSVNYMKDKVKVELLEDLPSSEEGRKRLDNYAALKEDLRKILEDLHWEYEIMTALIYERQFPKSRHYGQNPDIIYYNQKPFSW